jgi:predicted ATPase
VTFGEINVPDQKPPYLKEFHAHSVWGKYEFHVEFKDGVNFISGLNGSSKSTLLYLIYSSLNNAQPLPFLDFFASKSTFSDEKMSCISYFSNLDKSQQDRFTEAVKLQTSSGKSEVDYDAAPLLKALFSRS